MAVDFKRFCGGMQSLRAACFRTKAMPLLFVFACLLVLPPSFLCSQEDVSSKYAALYKQRCQSLNRLATKCDELGKSELAAFTRKWIPQRDPSRQYFFLTPAFGSPPLPQLSDTTDKFWADNFAAENRKYAESLFALSQLAVDQKRYAAAYRMLHESLFHDPQNRNSLRVLGEKESVKERIRVTSYRANPRRKQDEFLPKGELKKYESDNFLLYTSLDQQIAIKAIHDFEKFQAVWRQCFYSYWAKPSWLERRFEKQGKPLSRSKKFMVVMYRNKEEYIRTLSAKNPGIEVSVGYYWFAKKTSFFFHDQDPNISKTWIHELTHQLMHESVPISKNSVIQSSIWAVEGIAVYMESLMNFETHVTVGGEDAERLNYCRYNYFRRGFWVEISALNAMNQQDFVRNASVKALYSLSGAYCQFLMSNEDCIEEFFNFLRLVHQGKDSSRVFEKLSDQVSFDTGFKAFLKPDHLKIEASLIRPTAYKLLYLGYSGATDTMLEKVAAATELESLDLSGNPISDAGIKTLSGLRQLRYLSLDRTAISNASGASIGKLPLLEELDVTSTAITDEWVNEVSSAQHLVALWLAGTRVSDLSVPSLMEMPALKQLDVRKSKITQSGLKNLQQKVELID